MPQRSLPLPDHYDTVYLGVRVQLAEVPSARAEVQWNITVQMLRDPEGWTTLTVFTWEGVMLDLIPTLVGDVYCAFLWGVRGDVLRAAVSCDRAARAHLREHSF